MPLFEYACKECDKEFELLVRGSETPACPSCHSTELQRRLSVFAAHTNGGSSAVGDARRWRVRDVRRSARPGILLDQLIAINAITPAMAAMVNATSSQRL